jgi:3-oxoacyl-[acyl-carrier protein] reductase
MTDIANKVAIVTGGSRGIGAAIATHLGSQGVKVIVNYLRNREAADITVAAIRGAGGEAHSIAADVSQTEHVRRLFRESIDHFGSLDILINNAGYAQREAVPIAETSDDLYELVFASNTRSAFLCMREVAAHLREGGRVINISSTGVATGYPGYGVYNAAKSGIEIFTRVFAKEMQGRHVTVNCVAPGATATESWKEHKPQPMLEMIAKLSPLHRLGTPADVATVVGFLVRSDAEWINGQTIRLNGGFF